MMPVAHPTSAPCVPGASCSASSALTQNFAVLHLVSGDRGAWCAAGHGAAESDLATEQQPCFLTEVYSVFPSDCLIM